MGRGVYRRYYKGHKDKIKGENRGRGGRWERLVGGKSRRVFRNSYKGYMDKTKGM